jgi:hypothetical protein
MAFKDKKQDVIDIKLTQFGKGSFIRGSFQPVFYRFFDDGIIYDRKYAGVSEDQNSSEDRIKQDLTFDTQYLVKSVETRFEQESQKIKQGLQGAFLEIRRDENPTEKEKILQSPLFRCDPGSQEMPYYTVSSHTTDFTDTGPLQYLTQSGIHSKIPQTNINASYELITDRTKILPNPGALYDSETYIDLSADKIRFLDNSTLEIKEQMLALSVDEFNVPFTNDNFELELYEIIEESIDPNAKGSPKETRLVKLDDIDEVMKLFEIKTDKNAYSVPIDKRKTENFFTN